MFVLLCIPVLAVLYALPLVFGWVGPNPVYGFRNAKTRANAKLWYPANRIAGMYLIVAMAMCVALEFAVPGLHRGAAVQVATPLVQISGLIIANALTTAHVLRMRLRQGKTR
ncbi:MAG: SdpI family protein [Acidobacteriaceae bacterium]